MADTGAGAAVAIVFTGASAADSQATTLEVDPAFAAPGLASRPADDLALGPPGRLADALEVGPGLVFTGLTASRNV